MTIAPQMMISDRVEKASTHPEDTQLSLQANQLLSQFHYTDSPAMRAMVTDKLVNDNVLPAFLLTESHKLDADHDGKVSDLELQRGIVSRTPMDSLGAEILSSVKNLDTNKDGIISNSELADGKAYGVTDVDRKSAQFAADFMKTSNPNGFTMNEFQAALYAKASGDAAAKPGTVASTPLDFSNGIKPGDAAGLVPPPSAAVAESLMAAGGPLSVLQNADAKPEDRLQAIKALVSSGITNVTLHDKDGSEIKVRLESLPVGKDSTKSFVQMMAVDPKTGQEQVMMRAVSDGDKMLHQRDAKGHEVDFIGSAWNKKHPGSMFHS